MDNTFYKIFLNALQDREIQVVFPDLVVTPEQLVEMKCLAALEKIRKIVADDSLDDPECFDRIEDIVHILEESGLYCGGRHDFG